MRLNKTKVNGKIYLRVIDNYRNPKTGKNTSRVVRSFGELSKLQLIHDDPIAYCEEQVRLMNEANKLDQQQKIVQLQFKTNDFVKNQNTDNIILLGSQFLSHLYHIFGIDKLLNNITKKYKVKYNLNDIFKLLVFGRVLFSSSKKYTYEQKDKLGEAFSFTSEDMYRSTSYIAKYKNDLIKVINDNIRDTFYHFDTRITHYDLTNYYVYNDIFNGDENTLTKRGFSKEKSNYPLVQMGLITDRNGIPISYKLFSGNTTDVSTVESFLNDVQKEYGLKKSIIVSDAGIISKENMATIKMSGNGYIFKYPIRKMNPEIKKTFYNIIMPKIKEMILKYPNQEYFYVPIEIPVIIKGVKTREKYIFQYSKKSYDKDKIIRQEQIEKATKILNTKKVINNNLKSFIQIDPTVVNIETGEVFEEYTTIENFKINEKHIKEQEYFDGLSVLVTDQLSLKDEEIIKAYSEQYLIEETFRISKTDLKTRPMYVSKDDSIQAHFMVCYVSILMLKLLHLKLNRKYSVSKIKEDLYKYQYNYIGSNIYYYCYNSEILNELAKLFNVEGIYETLTPAKIKNIFKNSKKK